MEQEHASQHSEIVVSDGGQTLPPLHTWLEARLKTRNEAAAFLKVSRQTVDRLRYNRRLAYYQIGGSVRFGPWDLHELIGVTPVSPESLVGDVCCVLDKRDLSRFLSVSERTIEHLTGNHGLWHRKVGRCVRFQLRDVLAQLKQVFRVTARSEARTSSLTTA